MNETYIRKYTIGIWEIKNIKANPKNYSIFFYLIFKLYRFGLFTIGYSSFRFNPV